MNSQLRPVSKLLLSMLIFFTTLSVIGAARVSAVGPPKTKPGFPFSDPEQFFDRFFGKESPEDRKALEKIKIDPKVERQFGNRAAEAYLAQLKRQKIRVLSKGKDVDYLKKLVETIRPAMKNGKRYESIQVYLADSPRTDARSFPGGTLIFYRGMLDFAENEAALVGVIGHELSHLDHGHQLLPLRKVKLSQQPFTNAGRQRFDPREFMSNGMTLMRLFSRPFRPEDEAEADKDGATWAYQAGYDPLQMAELFLKLHERDQDKPKNQFMPDFFRTHPYHIDRYRSVQQLYDTLQKEKPNETLYVGKQNLKLRVTRAEKAFEE